MSGIRENRDNERSWWRPKKKKTMNKSNFLYFCASLAWWWWWGFGSPFTSPCRRRWTVLLITVYSLCIPHETQQWTGQRWHCEWTKGESIAWRIIDWMLFGPTQWSVAHTKSRKKPPFTSIPVFLFRLYFSLLIYFERRCENFAANFVFVSKTRDRKAKIWFVFFLAAHFFCTLYSIFFSGASSWILDSSGMGFQWKRLLGSKRLHCNCTVRRRDFWKREKKGLKSDLNKNRQ